MGRRRPGGARWRWPNAHSAARIPALGRIATVPAGVNAAGAALARSPRRPRPPAQEARLPRGPAPSVLPSRRFPSRWHPSDAPPALSRRPRLPGTGLRRSLRPPARRHSVPLPGARPGARPRRLRRPASNSAEQADRIRVAVERAAPGLLRRPGRRRPGDGRGDGAAGSRPRLLRADAAAGAGAPARPPLRRGGARRLPLRAPLPRGGERARAGEHDGGGRAAAGAGGRRARRRPRPPRLDLAGGGGGGGAQHRRRARPDRSGRERRSTSGTCRRSSPTSRRSTGRSGRPWPGSSTGGSSSSTPPGATSPATTASSRWRSRPTARSPARRGWWRSSPRRDGRGSRWSSCSAASPTARRGWSPPSWGPRSWRSIRWPTTGSTICGGWREALRRALG